MYYPYLRGKQFELILLRENAEFLAKNGIHPVIEPVKNDFAALNRAMSILSENKLNCTLIINPLTGTEPVPSADICNLMDNGFKTFKNISIGYILHSESKLPDLIDLLEKYSDFSFTLVHHGYTNSKELSMVIDGFNNIKCHVFIQDFAGKLYQRNLKKNGIDRILIRNGFKPQKKNSLYPPSEHFSDLHITYPDEGMDGFGDYLIVGDEYSESGGPAYAVAIHLTYIDPGEDNDMFIYHFVSDQTDSPTDPGGKFLEALGKLVAKINETGSLIFKSSACQEYLKLHDIQHYPGLGYVKKLSMQHHIELIVDYMTNELLS